MVIGSLQHGAGICEQRLRAYLGSCDLDDKFSVNFRKSADIRNRMQLLLDPDGFTSSS